MKKSLKYATSGALIIGLGNGIINAFKQIKAIENDSNKEFDWTETIKATGKGALIGGVSGAVVGGVMDLRNSTETPLDTNSILASVVSNMRMDKKHPVYKTLSKKAERIMRLIESNFKEKIVGHLIRVGSTEDGTAISENFDIDITVPFGHNSYKSTAIMYEQLLKFLKSNYKDKDLIKVREQRKSIGILFSIKNEKYKIDIVPFKLSEKSNNDNNTAGYLYVNNDSLFGKASYTKTDITSLTSIHLTSTQQKILIALKTWKKNYAIPISSHLLKMFILDAYSNYVGKIPRDFTKKILMIITHLSINIRHKRIISVENTNNVLTNINELDKISIQKSCKKVLEDYQYQPNSILKYF